MKTIISAFLLLIFSNVAIAESCGIGKVLTIFEGAWNTNDFMLTIDYSGEVSAHPGTEFNGKIVYKSTLNATRLNGIKSIALSAMMSGKNVKTYSHNNDCSNATEMWIYN